MTRKRKTKRYQKAERQQKDHAPPSAQQARVVADIKHLGELASHIACLEVAVDLMESHNKSLKSLLKLQILANTPACRG